MEQREVPPLQHELAVMPAPAGTAVVTAEAPIPPADSAPPSEPPTIRSRVKRITSLAALFSTLFISALNTTSIGTVIPTICRELDSAEGYAWITGAYLLGQAAFAPIWAKLSDIWGRKPILLCIVTGFFCSSIVCATASSMTMLIAGRALQGVIGGGLIQLVNIVISDLFSMRHRSLYYGFLEIIWTLACGVGPVLGGALAQHVGWRWVFWIMLPPCAVAFVLLAVALDVHNPRTGLIEGAKAVDWAGSFCMLGLLIMSLLGLNFGGVQYAWNSPVVICLLVFGFVMGAFFIFSEKKLARHPLLPLRIFTQRSNIAALFVNFAQSFALFSSDFYLPLFFQSAKALPPVESGVLMLPSTLTASLSGLFSGYYIHRTGRYMELIWLGQALMAAGYGAFISWSATSSLAMTCCTQFLAGVGTGMLFTPPLLALQASVAQKDTATATATVGLVRNLATILSVVVGQTIFQNEMNVRQGQLVVAGLNPQLQKAFSGNRAAASIGIISTIPDPSQKAAVKQAFAGSLTGIWILDMGLLALGLCSTIFMVGSKLSNEHTETRTGLEKGEKSEHQTP